MAKEEVKLIVEGITDGNSLEKMLGLVKGVYYVKADVANKTVTVWYNSELVALLTIKISIIEQGYEVK